MFHLLRCGPALLHWASKLPQRATPPTLIDCELPAGTRTPRLSLILSPRAVTPSTRRVQLSGRPHVLTKVIVQVPSLN
jgi:hypothetical protein